MSDVELLHFSEENLHTGEVRAFCTSAVCRRRIKFTRMIFTSCFSSRTAGPSTP